MPDGGSQSAITMRLNLLASGRLTNSMVKAAILELLNHQSPAPIHDVVTALGIAVRPHEIEHVERWPLDQLEMLREVVLTAIDQNRPTFYDFQLEDAPPSITVRDNGRGVFITFRSRPDV